MVHILIVISNYNTNFLLIYKKRKRSVFIMVENINNYVPAMLNGNQQDLLPLMRKQFPDAVQILAQPQFLPSLQVRIDEAEKQEKRKFESFNDLEVMYYYVHQEKDINENKNRSEQTRKEYSRDLLQFYYFLSHHHETFDLELSQEQPSVLKQLAPRHIRKYQEWLAAAPFGKGGKPYSVATLSKKTVILKSFLQFLYQNEYIEKPVHVDLKRVSIREEDKPNRDMSYAEMMQLIEYYEEHPVLHCLFSVLATTGIRIQELCTARVCDVFYDPSTGSYWLHVFGKGKKERDVRLLNVVLERIVAFRKRRGLETRWSPKDTSPLFVTNKLKKYNYTYLSRYITKAIMKSGLPMLDHRDGNISPHFFRHGAAIMLKDLGVPLYNIQLQLGHSQLSTTTRYLDKHYKRENSAAMALKEDMF
jgi:integrase/recombinase XerD